MKNYNETLQIAYIYSMLSAKVHDDGTFNKHHNTSLCINEKVVTYNLNDYFENSEKNIVKAFSLITAKDCQNLYSKNATIKVTSYLFNIDYKGIIELSLFVTVDTNNCFIGTFDKVYIYRIIDNAQLRLFYDLAYLNSNAIKDYLFSTYTSNRLTKDMYLTIIDCLSSSESIELIKVLKNGLIIYFNGFNYYVTC
jgi:hypothetical protein